MSVNDGHALPRWSALGPGHGDTAYRTQSLKYQPIELSLDESVTLWSLVRIWFNAFVASAIVWIFFGLFSLVILAGGNNPSGVFGFGALLSTIAFWVVFLLPVFDEPIAEWRILLEDAAPAADSAYAAIYGSLRRRQVPVTAQATRIRSDVLTPEAVNNRLVVSTGKYTAFVSVFPYGTSLYTGWTMWRRRRNAVLIWTYVKDVVAAVLGRSGVVNQMLRTETVRAMREAVHSAVREGVEVAVEGVHVPIAETFGRDVPIEDIRGAAGPSAHMGTPLSTTAPSAAPAWGPTPGSYPAPAPGSHADPDTPRHG